MKKNSKKVLLVFLVLSIVMVSVACKGDSQTADSSIVSTVSQIAECICPDPENCCGCTIYGDCICDENSDTSKETVSSGQSGTSEETSSSGQGNASSSPSASTPQGNSGKTPSQILKEVPASLRGSTITVYSWNKLSDVTGGPKAVSDFTKATGIKIDWKQGTYDGYRTEIAARINANNAPDIIRLKNLDPDVLGLLQPMSVTGYDFSDSAWDSRIMNYYKVGNNVYGVNLKNTLIQQPHVFYYNKAIVDEYGIDDPYELWKKGKWTWDELENMSKDLEEASSGQIKGFSLGFNDVYALSLGTSMVKYNGEKFTMNMNDSKLLTAYQKTSDLIKNSNGLNKWGEGEIEKGTCFMFATSIIYGRKTDYHLADIKKQNNLGVVPIPSIKGQQTYYQYFGEAEAYAIPKGAKNAKAVPYFLRYYLDGNTYDKNTFFNDKTFLEVYEHCMAQPTWTFGNDWSIIKDYYGVITAISDATGDQVKSKLDSFKGRVQADIDAANKKMEKLK